MGVPHASSLPFLERQCGAFVGNHFYRYQVKSPPCRSKIRNDKGKTLHASVRLTLRIVLISMFENLSETKKQNVPSYRPA